MLARSSARPPRLAEQATVRSVGRSFGRLDALFQRLSISPSNTLLVRWRSTKKKETPKDRRRTSTTAATATTATATSTVTAAAVAVAAAAAAPIANELGLDRRLQFSKRPEPWSEPDSAQPIRPHWSAATTYQAAEATPVRRKPSYIFHVAQFQNSAPATLKLENSVIRDFYGRVQGCVVNRQPLL